MRIRTQLFLGTVTLVLGLLVIQWWLQRQQLKAIEQELASVATDVTRTVFFQTQGFPATGEAIILPSPTGERKQFVYREQYSTRVETAQRANGTSPTILEFRGPASNREASSEPPSHPLPPHTATPPPGSLPRVQARIVPGKDEADRMIVISGIPGGDREVRLSSSGPSKLVQQMFTQSLIAGGVLLACGFAAAALFAVRVSTPLQHLVKGVEAIEKGELGTQVAVTAKGEVGELQATFNRMSLRLAALEREREEWRAREHLVELGELARGLGHTLRNPLNTLGLIIEELAPKTNGNSGELVVTARSQIRRIDQWLRSFLAVGAGGAAEPDIVELGDLARDAALESVQGGADVQVAECPERLHVRVVPTALRAALANLVGNAVEASPPGAPVVIAIARAGSRGTIEIIDSGKGLPAEVREKLFTPHVTTKTGGSGMGLFLSKQLIEGGQGGRLTLRDRPEGGTIATITLPLLPV